MPSLPRHGWHERPFLDPLNNRGGTVRWEQVLMTSPASQYDKLAYRPDMGGEFDEAGTRCLNTYLPSTLEHRAFNRKHSRRA